MAGIYFAVFAIAALFYKDRKVKKTSTPQKRAAILIPAYKEDDVIIESAKAMAYHKSMACDFDVWVIADSLKESTLAKLNNLPIKVLKVVFEKSTKSKAIKTCLAQLKADYHYAIVLDADNIPEVGFVDHLIHRLDEGYLVVQGHRTAKNNNTTLAILDGISEEVNNSIFRKGHNMLGLSASLIGSAFAFDFHLFRSMMEESKSVGGFDKELEVMLVERSIRIAYDDDAIVYDEKIQKEEAFIGQRRRWLSAQWKYFTHIKKRLLFKHLLKGNIDYVDKILQFLVPPRILALGTTFLLTVIHMMVYYYLNYNEILSALWIVSFILNVIAVIIAIPKEKLNIHLWRSILELPKMFALMLVALFQMKGANKRFIHTQHGIKN